MKAAEGVTLSDLRESTVKRNDGPVRDSVTSRRQESDKSDKVTEAGNEDSRDNVYATYWG